MKKLQIVIVLPLLVAGFWTSGATLAAFTTYSDRPSFDTANPGLATEGFEAGNVVAGSATQCTHPLDYGGDGNCFLADDLLPGVIYDTTGPYNLSLLGDGFMGASTKGLINNAFDGLFIMDFTTPYNYAVGMDLVCICTACYNLTVNIDVYGASGIITSEQSACAPSGIFFGIDASEQIARIEISGGSNLAEGVDNLSFTSAYPLADGIFTDGFETVPLGLCGSCVTDEDCLGPTDKCLSLDGGNFCGQDCSEGNPHGTPPGECQSGYFCADDPQGGGWSQCIPLSESCTCLEEDDALMRPCSNSNANGTYEGLQICNFPQGWSACDAEVPAPETCDGIDNDCNGLVDEGLTNACGGCAILADEPGAPCGTCGVWECLGLDDIVCADPCALP